MSENLYSTYEKENNDDKIIMISPNESCNQKRNSQNSSFTKNSNYNSFNT